MLDLDDFSDAVARVYDASMDVARWPEALSLLAGMFGAGASQITVASGFEALSFIKIWGVDEELLARLTPRYLALSPRDPRLLGFQAVRYKAMHCRQVVSDAALRASDIYKEVLAHAGIEYSMMFTVPIGDEMLCNLSVMRGPDRVVFTDDDCIDFGRFAPHVARAIGMYGTFHRCREELATVKAVLDDVPLGVMVVDADELKVANRAARTLLEEGDALRLDNGRLRGTTRQIDTVLRDAVQEARSSVHQTIGVPLPIEHDEPMRAVVRRLQADSAGMLGAPKEAVALYVTDPRKPMETPEEILQRLFGLTKREAAVLRILVEGGDLRSAARSLGVGFETVRSHVKRAKDAMGTRRRSELVRMVLSSPAWIAASNARSDRAPASQKG